MAAEVLLPTLEPGQRPPCHQRGFRPAASRSGPVSGHRKVTWTEFPDITSAGALPIGGAA